MTIIIKTPQPDTEERLVLVPPDACTPVFENGKQTGLSVRAQGARDATPDDLARGGYVPVERAEKAEWSARVARMALANEHQDREGVRIRKDLGTQDAPCPCDTDPEQGMGMHSPPCPLHEAVRELRRKTSWKDAALTLDGELKNALVRAEKAERALRCQCSEPGDSPCRVHDEERAEAAERALSVAVERAERAERAAAMAKDIDGHTMADLRDDLRNALARAEKAERELEVAMRERNDAIEASSVALSAKSKAERERDEARADLDAERRRADAIERANVELHEKLARLTAPGEGSEARQQPAKDRATDEELVKVGREAWNRNIGDDDSITAALRATTLAVAARVRQECLVAQAVARNADFHVTECMGGRWRVVVTDRDVNSKTELCAPSDVPATLARLLGEVSRG